MHKLILIFSFFFSFNASSQKQIAYQIFNAQGKKVSYKKMMKDITKSEILFFGEEHNNAIAHWLQLEITTQLCALKQDKVTLGFEMFESDQQMLLNDYLGNLIKERVFLDSCRWSNYKTDYQPLIQLAKNKSLPCVASNIPRKYASMVYKEGRASLKKLSADELELMCDINYPIDTTLSQYKIVKEMAMHSNGDFLGAQAIKDATMAKFIHKYWREGNFFIHFNGSFHSDFQQGIIWYLQQYRPELNFRTISVVSQDNVQSLGSESLNRANYIICVPNTMTKTH